MVRHRTVVLLSAASVPPSAFIICTPPSALQHTLPSFPLSFFLPDSPFAVPPLFCPSSPSYHLPSPACNHAVLSFHPSQFFHAEYCPFHRGFACRTLPTVSTAADRAD